MTTQQAKATSGFSWRSFLPILSWLPSYQRGWLRGDVIAALTVWALLVPEAMAYAGIAGMPPETGLYAAPLALLAYAVFGTSRHLNVGPSSAVAALSFTVVSAIVVAGSPEFFTMTVGLALLVGLLSIIGGLLRLGVLADFLSRPVLDGFVVGVAISIVVGQLDKILGFEPEGYAFLPEVLAFIRDIDLVDLPTLVVGLSSLILLFALHKFAPKVPAALVVLFLAIIVSYLLGFEGMGIHVAGEIPAGLPPIGLPGDLGLRDLLTLGPGAVGLALVAFAESVAIARSYATKYGYEVDANQELVALGMANLGSGISSGFTVDGSMSRTAAVESSDGKTQMVSIVAALAILVTAAALTPLFYHLPEATLAAIVIHAVWKNISYRRISQYRGVTTIDYITAIVAFAGVLLLGLLAGLLLASFLGLLALLVGTKNRNTAVLGRVAGTTEYRNLQNHPEGQTYPGLLILRFDGGLFFANTPNFISAVRSAINAADPPPKVIMIDGESMNSIDATAIAALRDLQGELARSNQEIRLARMKSEVLAVIKRAELPKTIPEEHIYPSIQAGVDAYIAEFGLEQESKTEVSDE